VVHASNARLVVVIDDEDCVRRAIGRLLRAAGLEAQTCGTGEAFFTLLDQGMEPGCVLLDLHLPGMDGYAILARIRRLRPQLPVIILTGHDSQSARDMTLQGGAAAFLRKPVDDEALLLAIARVQAA
jgi:FixJ family two-component response regulator